MKTDELECSPEVAEWINTHQTYRRFDLDKYGEARKFAEELAKVLNHSIGIMREDRMPMASGSNDGSDRRYFAVTKIPNNPAFRFGRELLCEAVEPPGSESPTLYESIYKRSR